MEQTLEQLCPRDSCDYSCLGSISEALEPNPHRSNEFGSGSNFGHHGSHPPSIDVRARKRMLSHLILSRHALFTATARLGRTCSSAVETPRYEFNCQLQAVCPRAGSCILFWMLMIIRGHDVWKVHCIVFLPPLFLPL